MTTTATRGAVVLVCFNFHAVSVARQCRLDCYRMGTENMKRNLYAVLAWNSCGGLVRLFDVISRFDTWNTIFKILRPNRFHKNASSFCWRAVYTLNFWCDSFEWSVTRETELVRVLWWTRKLTEMNRCALLRLCKAGWNGEMVVLIAFQFCSKCRSLEVQENRCFLRCC